MSLDRAIGEEERRGDLLVRSAERDERGDTFLCRRKRAGSRRAPADALQLGSGALGPEHRADSLEDGERFLERRSRFASLLQPPLRRAEREQRPTAVERELDLCVPVERGRERGQCGLELTRLRGEESPAARAVGERGDAPEPAGVPFVPVQELGASRSSSELDERLDVVDDESGRAGLDDPFSPDERSLRRQVLDDVARPLEREGKESKSRGCDEDDETVRVASR